MNRAILLGLLVSLAGCTVEPHESDSESDAPLAANKGVCSTCSQRGVCVTETSAKACGAGGEACQACTVGPCEIGFCLDGECAVFIAPDNTPCGRDYVWICTSGVCAPP